MTFVLAPSKTADRACARADAMARALAVSATTMMRDVVLPPPRPGRGHP